MQKQKTSAHLRTEPRLHASASQDVRLTMHQILKQARNRKGSLKRSPHTANPLCPRCTSTTTKPSMPTTTAPTTLTSPRHKAIENTNPAYRRGAATNSSNQRRLLADTGITNNKTVWPSGLRRWLQAPVRKGVGQPHSCQFSSPTRAEPQEVC